MAFTIPSVQAKPFAEKGDAGISEGTAMIVPPGVNLIIGTLKPGTDFPFGANPVDVDVYAFTLSKPTSVRIEANSWTADMNLLLLREGFYGIYGDDDGGGNNNSLVPSDGNPLVLPRGTYYVAVGRNNIGAYPYGATMVGDEAWENDDDLLDASKAAVPIHFIGGNGIGPNPTFGDRYEIVFNFFTSVTGLDLSLGKGSGKFKGVDVIKSLGRQTLKVKGGRSAKFKLRLANTGGARRARLQLSPKPRAFDVQVRERKAGNVTAAVLQGKYAKKLKSGEARTMQVKVQRKESSTKRKGKLVFRTYATAKRSIQDRVRAKLSFRG